MLRTNQEGNQEENLMYPTDSTVLVHIYPVEDTRNC